MSAKNSPHRIETSWKFLKGFETSSLEGAYHTAFSSGIEVVLIDFVAKSTVEHIFSIEQSPITFSFQISGHAQGNISFSGIKNECITGCPGEALISFIPDSCSRTTLFESQHYRTLTIYIDPHCLNEKLGNDLEQVPVGLHHIIQNASQIPFNQKLNICPHIRIILDQIFNCPYHGAMKKRLF